MEYRYSTSKKFDKTSFVVGIIAAIIGGIIWAIDGNTALSRLVLVFGVALAVLSIVRLFVRKKFNL